MADKSDLKWTINANIGINRNKLKKLNSNLDFQLGPSIGFSQAYPILFMVDQPFGIYWEPKLTAFTPLGKKQMQAELLEQPQVK